MAKTQATAKTLEACRKLGWMPGVVERSIYGRGPGGVKLPHATKKDLFGFIDIAVITNEPGVLFIQATAGSNGNARARIRKIEQERTEEAIKVLAAGNKIEVWCWRKYKVPTKAGGTKVRWDAKRWEIVKLCGCVVALPISSYLELKTEGGESR